MNLSPCYLVDPDVDHGLKFISSYVNWFVIF